MRGRKSARRQEGHNTNTTRKRGARKAQPNQHTHAHSRKMELKKPDLNQGLVFSIAYAQKRPDSSTRVLKEAQSMPSPVASGYFPNNFFKWKQLPQSMLSREAHSNGELCLPNQCRRVSQSHEFGLGLHQLTAHGIAVVRVLLEMLVKSGNELANNGGQLALF